MVSAQSKRASCAPFTSSQRTAHGSGNDRGNAPPNDDCANAEAVTVTPDCATPITGTTMDAAEDGGEPVCDSDAGPYLDVWYTFNSGSETDVWITLTPITAGMDYAFTLQDACGGAEIYCVALPGSALEVPVITNTNYWLRVYSNATYGPPGDFALCVSTDVIIAPPPFNDLCSSVTAQTVAIGNTATYTGDNTGATDNDGLGYNIVWEAFSLNACADVKVDYCGTTPSWSNYWFLIYTDCSASTGIWHSSSDTSTCGDQNFTVCYANLSAGTYYVPILQNVFSTGPYTLHVSAVGCGTEQASNDECEGAFPLMANAACQPNTFSNLCATQSLPAMLCDNSQGLANDDVWYSFVATSTDMSVGGAPNGSMDIAMQLFSGTCANLTAIACADLAGAGGPDDLQASSLSVGTTYYLRVYDWDNGHAFEEPSYDLCVVEGLGSGVGVEESTRGEDLVVFPNPTIGDFSVRVDPNSALVTVSVIDATGRTVFVRIDRITMNGTLHVHAAGKLIPGFYMVRVDDGRTRSTTRLMVE